jgi:filamentous hemagglutinin family protein
VKRKSLTLNLANSILISLLTLDSAKAQVVPDSSLPINSSVSQQGSITQIDGGTQQGGNLFHSFSQFSVSKGNTAYFNNSLNINNVFSRVTGGSISNIDGLIKTNGKANLFLINPAGIIFGENASLDVNGSFFATTAETVLFEDGISFSANLNQTSPLLTISVPIGLSFNQNPGSITVAGEGHQLSREDPLFSQFMGAGQSSTGLAVGSGQTLGLIGGEVLLDGAVITAPSGKVEITSVASGTVGLDLSSSQAVFSYPNVTSYSDVTLRNQSLLDASGIGGNIDIHGANIYVNSGSAILIQNQGYGDSGDIFLSATKDILVDGSSSNPLIPTYVINETISNGDAGDININANNLQILNGGQVDTRTYTSANSGSINLFISNDLSIQGYYPSNPLVVSSVREATLGIGDSGDFNVQAHSITIQNGGFIGSLAFSSGRSGDISINANSLLVDGISPFGNQSTITTSTFSSGSSGTLNLNVANISIFNGGVISTATSGSGDAGSILVNADTILIDGFSQVGGTNLYSAINSNSFPVTFLPYYKLLLTPEPLPLIPTGKPGSISIDAYSVSLNNLGSIRVTTRSSQGGGIIDLNTAELSIQNGGNISAETFSSGNAGNIFINTHDLNLRDGGFILTSTLSSGNAGDIFISADNIDLSGSYLLDPSFGSSISSSSSNDSFSRILFGAAADFYIPKVPATGNSGNVNINAHNIDVSTGASIRVDSAFSQPGGNIFLTSDVIKITNGGFISSSSNSGTGGNVDINSSGLFLDENSFISANSTQTLGGSVFINSQVLFISPDSKITATGGNPQLNGFVQINTLNQNFTGVSTLPTIQRDVPETPFVCGGRAGNAPNSFVNAGNGGIPEMPSDLQSIGKAWLDTESSQQPSAKQSSAQPTPDPLEFVEAQGWRRNANGTVDFVSNPAEVTPYGSLTTPPCSQAVESTNENSQ